MKNSSLMILVTFRAAYNESNEHEVPILCMMLILKL